MAWRMLQIDAFAARPFEGNPAAVVFLPSFPEDATMAAIARENNLSETAFLVRREPGHYDLRWFTPALEVELCGHATLASGAAVLEHTDDGVAAVTFDTRSGPLVVRRVGDEFEMDLPSVPPKPGDLPDDVVAALGQAPVATWAVPRIHGAAYWLCRYETVADIDQLSPNHWALAQAGCNVIVTAPGDQVDFVSRFFAPASGVQEDPVTGSAHCSLTPYWAAELGRTELTAHQRSSRGGFLTCRLDGSRVRLRGPCVRVLEGELHVG